MRAVLDTNVLVSGLFWLGAPHDLIEQVRHGSLSIITSPALLSELGDVIRRPKLASILRRLDTTPDEVLEVLAQMVEVVDPAPLTLRISRDPDDDAILALAVAARAELIVSGDTDLLSLGSHAGIPIVVAAEAFRIVTGNR